MALRINDNGTDREMTPDEEAAFLASLQVSQAEAQARADERSAKEARRIAVLNKLGLTEDEAADLFS